ncbi:MAG: ribose 1,5-bisphosphate isomerase [Archaeoglobaceae archaeon]|nr:ribose 1,5-bisphosphate isomerase [Archaeoglobaceae archaeon]MDW8117841.1 ribose 1,5-bisphosphate isomerase [Archaeoglobaceae archaeon]
MDLHIAAEKIRSMEVRGASRIAKFAAEVMREQALKVEENFDEEMLKASKILLNTRPTAVSLFNAINYIMRYQGNSVEEKRANLVSRANEFISWVDNAQKKIAEIGEKRIKNGYTILTHCNSSTAVAIMKRAHEVGKKIEVIATESRPRLQGHITARQLREAGIEVTLIVDSAVRSIINDVDCVIVGADTITANGALVNKIGTSQVALCAKEARVPFMVAAETFKFSPKTLLGDLVLIEERSADEVAPKDLLNLGVRVRNPAFDVTPRSYIDVIITEIGAIPPEMAYIVIKERLGYIEISEEEFKVDFLSE